MNILYTLNDKFVPQVAAGICSVCENNKEMDEINFYLISDGITTENQIKLNKLTEKYNRKLTIKELGNIKDYINFDFDTTGWNPIVLARLVLDKFLPNEMEKVLYLDGDTIVRGSLKDLWNTDISEYVLAASIEPTMNDKKRKISLGIENKPYYNAGVLLINLKKWRNENEGKNVLDFYRENKGNLFANDQDAINGALVGKIYTMSPTYNFYNIFYTYSYKFLSKIMKPVDYDKYIKKETFEKAVKNPKVIHYLGEERPWRKGNKHKYKQDYLKYLNITEWKGEGMESGWQVYFICWNIFNICTKPFPKIRYQIIDKLIPVFIKIRANKNKKNKESK